MTAFELGVVAGKTVTKTVKYGIVLGLVAVAVVACSGKEETKVEAPVATVELTPEEKKQKAFESERTVRGYILTKAIKESAFDSDALKIERPKYYSNGVCVRANGKNRFGAYVGWQEYCYLVNDKGVWTYSGPN
jgi:hypothetical protein